MSWVLVLSPPSSNSVIWSTLSSHLTHLPLRDLDIQRRCYLFTHLETLTYVRYTHKELAQLFRTSFFSFYFFFLNGTIQ